MLVNVKKEELIEQRRKYISDAVAPLNSVLDDSLGCVLWFASRALGRKYIAKDDLEEEITVLVKILY